MDSNTKKVITDIASIQIEALDQMKSKSNGLDLGIWNYLDVSETVEKLMDTYSYIKRRPELINFLALSEYQIMICIHIIYRLQKDPMYRNANNEGIYGAFEELNKKLVKFHPEFKTLFK